MRKLVRVDFCKECLQPLGEYHQEGCSQIFVNEDTGASTYKPDDEAKALDVQVGGGHYKKYIIQPVEYAMANQLNYCQANAIKYVTRYKDKNGAEDICKAIHNLNILLQLEYNATYEELTND